jgi:hypothetical protein
VKLTIHLQLVPRSRKCGSIDPFPIHLHGVVLNSLSIGTSFYWNTLVLYPVRQDGSTTKPEAAPRHRHYRTQFLCNEPNSVTDLRRCFTACYSLNERYNLFKPFSDSGIDSACLSLKKLSQAHISDDIGFVASLLQSSQISNKDYWNPITGSYFTAYLNSFIFHI